MRGVSERTGIWGANRDRPENISCHNAINLKGGGPYSPDAPPSEGTTHGERIVGLDLHVVKEV